jgi:hypothetical protein
MIVALRLLIGLLAIAPTNYAIATHVPHSDNTLLVLGHLMFPAHAYTLLFSSLCLQLQPAQHLWVHTAATILVIPHSRSMCSAPYFQDAGVDSTLAR